MNPTEPPRDKAKYSYEEMMEQLRDERGSGSRGGGGDTRGGDRVVRTEIVEGPDGKQQVTEVRRRRKRRTHQPKKVKEQRMKMLRRALVFGAIPLGLLFFGGGMLMLSRVRGEGFRKAASARVSELVGAEVEFGRFRLSGLELNSRKAVVTGGLGGLLREAELVALRARVNPSTMLSNDWSLGFVQASGGSLRFGPGAGAGDVAALSRAEVLPLVAAGLGLGSAPQEIDVTGLRIASTNLFWDTGIPNAAPFIEDTGLSAGDLSDPVVGMSLRGGKLAVPGWREFGIETISGDVSKGVYQVRRSSLLHVKDGALALEGKVSMVGAGDYHFTGEYSDMDLREFVHPYWSDKLNGELDGNIVIEGALTRAGSLKAEGEFSISDLVFSNNSMLKRLSMTIGESLLARLQFRSFRGRYRRMADRVEIYDLQGEHLSLLRVSGNFTVFADGRLDGELELSLPEQILAKAEGGKPSFFGAERDGFAWVTVKLGGMVDDPREDLTPRLQQALREFLEARDRVLPGTGVQRFPAKSPPPRAGAGAALEDTFERLIER